jgi:hypothetical protein
MKNKKIISMAALLLTSLSATQAQTIAAWTFENNAVAINNSPAPSADGGTASSIGMNLYPTPNVGVTTDDVVMGKNSDTGVNGVANTSNTWRIRGQAGSNGAANGWSSVAPIGTQGAVFATSTVGTGFNGISVTFDWYDTTQGEANMQLEYTTDGSTWQNVPLTLSGSDAGLQVLSNNGSDVNTVTGSYVSDNLLTGGLKAGQDWFTGLTATITDPNAANDPNFAIEMVNASTGADDVSSQGTALNNNSGNWRFDNIAITAVPEPPTLALTGGGLAALLALQRRSRKS